MLFGYILGSGVAGQRWGAAVCLLPCCSAWRSSPQGGYPQNGQAVEGERQKRGGEMTALQQRLLDESRYAAGPKR